MVQWSRDMVVLCGVAFVVGTGAGWWARTLHDADPTGESTRVEADGLRFTRSAGFGPGPNYRLTLSAGGHVVYEGFPALLDPSAGATIPGREGRFVGRIPNELFESLLSRAGASATLPPPPPSIDGGYAHVTLTGSATAWGPPATDLIGTLDSLAAAIEWREAPHR